MNIPIIRLEVESMKYQICTVLSDYAAQMDEDMRQAVEDFCTPENIQRIVKTTAGRVLEQTIREEVEKFFRCEGEGRKAIAAAVKESILKKETYGPLDEI